MTTKTTEKTPAQPVQDALWGSTAMWSVESRRQDRIAGVLVGQACGDALGAGYETGKRPPKSGAVMCGGGFGFAPGEFTDDTQEAVCVALARSDPQMTAALLLAWYRSRPKDVGSQTRAVLSRAATPRGVSVAARAYARRAEGMRRPSHFDPGSGNGSLMRTGPVCLPHLGDRDRIAQTARKISDLTHADPYDGDSCTLWSIAIARAVELGGAFKPAMVLDGLDLIPEQRRWYWRREIARALGGKPADFRGNSGGSVGCFRVALSAVAHSEGYEDGVQLAVCAGGDCDTTAAVAGALLGAWHGMSMIPARWRNAVWGWPGMRAHDLERLTLEAAGSGAA